MPDEQLVLRLRAQGAPGTARDVDRVGSSLGRAGRAADRAGKSFGRGTTSLRLFGSGLKTTIPIVGGAAGALGIYGLAGAMRTAITEFRESRAVTRQTNAVLKSTSSVANVTAAQIGNLANAISLKAGIDDEAIQSAENVLLTFTKLRNETGKGNDIFNQATQAVTDLSVSMKIPLKNAAILVGKALQDPEKGITALRRIGVNFNKEQQKTITGWVKQGKTMKAQKFILRELNTEFAGSAVAQADPLNKLKVAWLNLEEEVGRRAWPLLTRVVNSVTPALIGLSQDISNIFDDKTLNWDQKISKLGDAVSTRFGPLIHRADIPGHVAQAFKWAAPRALNAFWNGFKGLGPGGKAVTVAFLATKLGLTGAVLRGLGRAIGGGIGGAGGGLAGAVTGRGATPANPLFVAVVAGGGPGVGGAGRGGSAARTALSAAVPALPVAGAAWLTNKYGDKKTTSFSGTDPGGSPGRRSRVKPGTSYIEKRLAKDAGDGGPIFPPVIIQLDGKTIATAVARHGTKKKSTK